MARRTSAFNFCHSRYSRLSGLAHSAFAITAADPKETLARAGQGNIRAPVQRRCLRRTCPIICRRYLTGANGRQRSVSVTLLEICGRYLHGTDLANSGLFAAIDVEFSANARSVCETGEPDLDWHCTPQKCRKAAGFFATSPAVFSCPLKLGSSRKPQKPYDTNR